MKEIYFTPEIDDSKPSHSNFYKYKKKTLKKLRRRGKKMVNRWVKEGLVKLPDWDSFINGH